MKVLSNKIFSKKKIIVLFLLLILFSIIFTISFFKKNQTELIGNIKVSEIEKDWVNYTNIEYNFSIDFPSSWRVSEYFVDANPIINIYKPKFNYNEPPYDHFDDIPNVSIFPNGVPTESLIGEINHNSDIKLIEEIAEIKNYVLDNGEIWARMITFQDYPRNWKSWGFLWMKLEVNNLENFCSRDGQIINILECNPFGGDVFIRKGQINKNLQKTQIKILESFHFLK